MIKSKNLLKHAAVLNTHTHTKTELVVTCENATRKPDPRFNHIIDSNRLCKPHCRTKDEVSTRSSPLTMVSIKAGIYFLTFLSTCFYWLKLRNQIALFTRTWLPTVLWTVTTAVWPTAHVIPLAAAVAWSWRVLSVQWLARLIKHLGSLFTSTATPKKHSAGSKYELEKINTQRFCFIEWKEISTDGGNPFNVLRYKDTVDKE